MSSAGGNAEGSGGTASYSIGQIFYSPHTGSAGSLVEGVQQPYEISVITSIEETAGINLIMAAYPNPATDYVTLVVDNYNSQELSFHLLDVNGRLIKNKIITGIETLISVTYLTTGTYFLRVIDNHKHVKTFKIIKK